MLIFRRVRKILTVSSKGPPTKGVGMNFARLGVVSDLLTWMIDDPTFGASLLIATGPFVMTCLTAWFFEARVVSLFHGQSLSFFPGEIILCLTMIALVYGAGRIVPSSDEFLVWWSSNGAILSLAMAFVLLWRRILPVRWPTIFADTCGIPS